MERRLIIAMNRSEKTTMTWLLCAIACVLSIRNAAAFSPSFVPRTTLQSNVARQRPLFLQPQLPSAVLKRSSRSSSIASYAGGFEWEDPEEQGEMGVENPFKKGASVDETGMKVDPARLLGPRLQGTNLYVVGLMGTGKSAVGDALARRKLRGKCIRFLTCRSAITGVGLFSYKRVPNGSPYCFC